MADESPLRLALVVIVAVSIGISGYHRWQAARGGERISRREEGFWIGVPLRLAGLVMLLSTLAYLVDPSLVAWAQISLPGWLRWVGAAAGLLCATMLYWTLSNLGKNLTDTVATRQNAVLVTRGPYRYVRHPFYVSVALLILSVSLLSANLLIAGAGLTVMTLLTVRTPKEEQKLIEKFGDDYRAYMARTGRFVPRWPVGPGSGSGG